MAIKPYLIAASYLFAIFLGWHVHTWYEGYEKSKEQSKIITDRVKDENLSNADAAKTLVKEDKDNAEAQAGDAALAAHIDANKQSFDCAVPAIGVLDLRQAIGAPASTVKSNPIMPQASGL